MGRFVETDRPTFLLTATRLTINADQRQAGKSGLEARGYQFQCGNQQKSVVIVYR